MIPHIFTEIYVHDVKATTELLLRLFDARLYIEETDYAEIYIGETRLHIQALDMDEFEVKNPVKQPGALEHLGAGVEIGVMVQNLEPIYSMVQKENLPYVSEILVQPWGMRDFRFLLPDGYYIRVTEPPRKTA